MGDKTELLDFSAIWEQIMPKVDRMIAQIGDKSPHVAGADGKYDDKRIDWWTSGFWPGILWIMHDMTGDDRYKEVAWHWDERLERFMLEPNHFDHDVGFHFLPTAVIKHKVTRDEDAVRRGLFAANFMAGRFNLNGGFIRAWNGDHQSGWSIVDTAMNLALLFWATKESGDPRFGQIAEAHADTVVRAFIRDDGSVNHIVSFDPETGEVLESLGGQGAAPDSGWSRGTAWALYGMTIAYRYTGKTAYLHAAQRVAHYFIAHLPEDHVPHWDFRADGRLDDEPRDSSAGACAASGLIELSMLLTEKTGRVYRDAAERILQSLYRDYGTWDDAGHEAILRHGTGHKPAGQNVDVSLIYGDYFFVEAIAKLKGWKHRIF
ncbi:glycoside hydrolase family 88 protein [Cohnella lupini]|uniref:Unsaturated chondroitin disaccharide hydrolase n=1 Tax=Cohnella lupini TaxID=1294267 RepID=A0A3D9I1D7_9BACL|nr:glycoside hydrolase family 88 protein [Cohnella lupini]RED55554.1 unsaturated chondroitin disaccharide hydrolase [Cohnella lupini]